MALKKDYLIGLCGRMNTYDKGETYFKSRRVRVLSDTQKNGGIRVVRAEVSGSQKYESLIELTPDGTALRSYGCSCPAIASYGGPCKHVVALALHVSQSAPPGPRPVKTDNMAMQMLRQYAQKSMQAAAPPGMGVKLEPTLDLSASVPSVSFKVGLEHMYVLKDLQQFVRDVRGCENHAYGKNFSFVHHLNAFEPESARLAKFLLTCYDENNDIYAPDYHGYRSGYRDMFLPPFMLDALLDLYDGRALNVETRPNADMYAVKTENPRLRLHIDQSEGGNYTLRFPKPFRMAMGSERIYLSLDRAIYRCDSAFSSATRELFAALTRTGARPLTIAEGDMPMLAATLLPALSPYVPVVSNSDLTVFQPPTLESRVYFDMPEPEVVTARLEHSYDGKAHPGFQGRDMRRSLDLSGEMKLETVMLRYFKEENRPGEVIIHGDEKALFELADHGVAEISELAEVFVTDSFKAMQVKPPATVSVGVRVDSNLLRLQFDVSGMDLSELAGVLDSYRKAKKYHRLRDGSFLSLEASSLSEFSELAQGLELTAREIMAGELDRPKYRALYLDALLRQSERMQYDRDGAFKQIIRDVRDVSDADDPIPQGLRHILRNYQKTGYRWLRTIAAYGFGGILADDMGLGKTVQVLALLLAQKEEQTEHTVSMVVCPSSLVLNWETEAHKFTPALSAVAVTGTSAQREALIRAATGSADLLITSYDSLKRDVEQYAEISFRFTVADEAQSMKNQNTQNAKAVKTLRSSVRFALTGTPVENSLAEVWSIFDFLMPGYLYHYAKFRKQFETPIVRQGDESAAGSLRKMVAPFILRRMKKDVLKELPDKIETVRYAELEDEQKKVYLATAAAARKELEAGLSDSGADKLQILALLTRLRQICCDPALIYENYTAGSAKLELCLELVENCVESGHRLLLFSQFTSMLGRIAARLDAAGVPYFTITGETKVSQRLELVNSFNSGETPVFLISLKAGGTGLNLTGADVVIHYDPWWNSSAQNQASDRAHRIGQTKTVQVYKLIAKDTLEERILEMQQSKSDLADLIVKEGDSAFVRMTKSEILALFE